VDDTILLLEDDFEMAKNLKLVLHAFEKLPDLKIIFHKSKMYCFEETFWLQGQGGVHAF
jgi:hypothetical protein